MKTYWVDKLFIKYSASEWQENVLARTRNKKKCIERPDLSIFCLNVNSPVKTYRVAKWIKT